MVKLFSPFLTRISGSHRNGPALCYRTRAGQIIAERPPIPTYTRTEAQDTARSIFRLAADDWHALSAADQASYRAAAGPHGLTGYQYYLHLSIPGYWLPYYPVESDFTTGCLRCYSPVTWIDTYEFQIGGFTSIGGGYASLAERTPTDAYRRITFKWKKPAAFSTGSARTQEIYLVQDTATQDRHAGYYFPVGTCCQSRVWHSPGLSSTYTPVTLEIDGPNARTRINGGGWSAIGAWFDDADSYNIEFSNRDYRNYPAYFRDIFLSN